MISLFIQNNKLLLTKVIKFFLSPTLISIVISICLLVNLFVPRFATFLTSEKGEFPSEHHACGCTTAPDFLSPCCCVKTSGALEMKCSLKKNSNDILSTFIQSLACSDTIDQFTAVLDTIRLPDAAVFIPDIYLFYYQKATPSVFPVSFPISPSDKPPRIT